MARAINKLSAAGVKAARYEGKAKKHFDGGGLFLLVNPVGKYWRFRYIFSGKERLLSLGVYPEVSLADAREKRDEARKLVAAGIDPSADRKAKKVASQFAGENTFELVAREWFEAVHKHKVVESHSKNNLRRLEVHVFPCFGKKPISEVLPLDILHALKPLQSKGKNETAKRIKGLCGQIFRYAIPTGRVDRDITADLKEVLRPSKVRHHPAITEPDEIKHLLRAIDQYDGRASTVSALRIAPYLFVRPGELRTMKWCDLDLEAGIWHYVPSKNGQPLQSPLLQQVIQILEYQRTISGHSKYVFPSDRTLDRPMSNNALSAALNRLGYKDKMTPHGFRAMARTVLAERLNQPIEHIEMQLAHSVKDANGRAYNRTTYFEQRKQMLQGWADYLDSLKHPSGKVIVFKKALA